MPYLEAAQDARQARKWRCSYVFGEIAVIQPLLYVMVVQWRGLSGSMGWLNALLSWVILINAATQWTVALINLFEPEYIEMRVPKSVKYIEGLELSLRKFFTLTTAFVCGLSMITRGLSPTCPDEVQVLDIQFCNSSPRGLISFDNFLFMIVLQQLHYEFLPTTWFFTSLGLAIGFACTVSSVIIVWDARYSVSCFWALFVYVLSGYFLYDKEVRRKPLCPAAAGSDDSDKTAFSGEVRVESPASIPPFEAKSIKSDVEQSCNYAVPSKNFVPFSSTKYDISNNNADDDVVISPSRNNSKISLVSELTFDYSDFERWSKKSSEERKI
jgi:hypothetical protein